MAQAGGGHYSGGMRVLIVGCGYVGQALGVELVKQGLEVFGLRRRQESAEELAKLPAPFDWVINTVSSTKGGVEEYRQVYLNGTRHLIERLAPTPLKKFVYTSSTSVYGQTDGSSVKESSPAEPQSPTSRLLVATEKLLLEAAREKKFPALILRVAGIYGPGRGHLFR